MLQIKLNVAIKNFEASVFLQQRGIFCRQIFVNFLLTHLPTIEIKWSI